MGSNQEYEFIKHTKGLNFRAYFISIEQRLQHWHGDIEVLYLVQGTVNLMLGSENIRLSKGDIFVVNHFDIHALRQTDEGNLLFVVQFTPSFCKSYFSDLQYIRFSDQLIRPTEDAARWKSIQPILIEMITSFAESKPNFQFLLMALLNQLVYAMLGNLPYTLFAQKEIDSYESNLDRLNRILIYIYNNAAYKITLEDLAARESLSMFYLSHFIRQFLGVSYQEYLAQIRLSNAVGMLTTTDKSISSIAIESGFSDIKYLNRHFNEVYGCSPADYRKKNSKKDHPTITLYTDKTTELSIGQDALRELIRELKGKEKSP